MDRDKNNARDILSPVVYLYDYWFVSDDPLSGENDKKSATQGLFIIFLYLVINAASPLANSRKLSAEFRFHFFHRVYRISITGIFSVDN